MSSERKDDHVRLAAAQQEEPRVASNAFDDVVFVHHALTGIDAERVDLTSEVLGARWHVPLYINAMTGGSDSTGRINRDLAIAAREAGVPLASGSMSVALEHPGLAPTFRVLREEHPDGFLFANLGVERTPDDARRAIDLIEANALQVHVNSVQETVMPEGRRAFSSWQRSLESLVTAVDVPVVVKEVGFGLSSRTLAFLADLGVAAADVSGRGGTDFVRVENARREGEGYSYLAGWGQSAVECLMDAPAAAPMLLASGGVRTPLDAVRALALGARAVGVSGPFLKTVLDGGPEALASRLGEWIMHLTALSALLGAASPSDLTRTDLVVRGDTAEFCRARGIDLVAFSRRSDRRSDAL